MNRWDLKHPLQSTGSEEAQRASVELDSLLQEFLEDCHVDIETDRLPEDVTGRLQRVASECGQSPADESPAGESPADIDLQPRKMPSQVGAYRIIEPIRSGGMGDVYRARHTVLDCDVALKTLGSRRENSPSAAERFKREMRLLAALNHPNVVRAYDAAVHDDVMYLAMELVDGWDLRELARRQSLSVDVCCELIRQGAIGLEAMHRQGVIHRDIKPANLMLTRSGVVKLVDFGLALMVRDGFDLTSELATMGTDNYMSPEQMLGHVELDQRSDIYSLGRTFHYLLQPTKPHLPHSIDRAILARLPDKLAELLDGMLAVDRNQRVSSAEEVVHRLEPFCKTGIIAELVPFPAQQFPARETFGRTNDGIGRPAPNMRESPQPGTALATESTQAIPALLATDLICLTDEWPPGQRADVPVPLTVPPARRVRRRSLVLGGASFAAVALSAVFISNNAVRQTEVSYSKTPSVVTPAEGVPSTNPKSGPAAGKPFDFANELQVANWVIERGGKLVVNTIGNETKGYTVAAPSDFPAGEFVVQTMLIRRAELTDRDLRRIGSLRNLESLNVDGDSFTDSAVAYLNPAWNLKWLYLQCPRLSDRGVAALRPFRRSLQNLDLSTSSVTDSGLEFLLEFSVLREVLVRRTAITDEGLECLSRFPTLVSLDLSFTHVTDKGMEHLARCTKLRKLQLNTTLVSDAGLRELMGLPLELLSLSGSRVTRTAAERFREEHRGCEVTF